MASCTGIPTRTDRTIIAKASGNCASKRSRSRRSNQPKKPRLSPTHIIGIANHDRKPANSATSVRAAIASASVTPTPSHQRTGYRSGLCASNPNNHDAVPVSDWSRCASGLVNADTSNFCMRTCGVTTIASRASRFWRKFCARDTRIPLSPSPASDRQDSTSSIHCNPPVMRLGRHLDWPVRLPAASRCFRVVQCRFPLPVKSKIRKTAKERGGHFAYLVLPK